MFFIIILMNLWLLHTLSIKCTLKYFQIYYFRAFRATFRYFINNLCFFLGLLVSLSGICTGLLISLYGIVVENFGFFIGEQLLILTIAISLFFGILLYLSYFFKHLIKFKNLHFKISSYTFSKYCLIVVLLELYCIEKMIFPFFRDEISGGILNEGRCFKRKTDQTSKKDGKSINTDPLTKEEKIQSVDSTVEWDYNKNTKSWSRVSYLMNGMKSFAINF